MSQHKKVDHKSGCPHTSSSSFPTEAAEKATLQYQKATLAKRYVGHVISTATDRREQKCVDLSLKIANIPAGSTILDCPCGPGRLIPMLKKHGFTVTGADVSPAMVDQARLFTGPEGNNCLMPEDKLCVANLFDTGFADNQFDAVLCHRVFQYFSQSAERTLALKEIRRITPGPVVISFLCNWSLDALWYYVRRALNLTRARKCKPISPTTFARDIHAAGYEAKTWIAMRPFISKRWYVVLQPVKTSPTTFTAVKPFKRIVANAAIRAAAVFAVTFAFFAGSKFYSAHPIDQNHIMKILKQYDDGDENFYISRSINPADITAGVITRPVDPATIHNQVAADQQNRMDSIFLLSSSDVQSLRSSQLFAKLSFIRQVKIGSELFSLMRIPDNE